MSPYVTVPRDLEFCTNIRHPCDTSPNEAEVRSTLARMFYDVHLLSFGHVLLRLRTGSQISI